MTRRTRLRLLFPLRHLGTTIAREVDADSRRYYFAFESHDGESNVVLSVPFAVARQACERWRGELTATAARRIAETSARGIILAHAAHCVRHPDDATT